MREVVVHVPTLELAEKVLKVAQEIGLYTHFNKHLNTMIKVFGDKLCFRLNEDDSNWADIEHYEKNNYKIITAEEFLSRYKPKFKPIAMRCSKEQFKAVRPKLEKLGKIGNLTGAFEDYKYLTNNYNVDCNCFDFISESEIWENTHKNNIHHDWDEPVFLQHCVYIEEEPTELEQLRKENAELKEQLKAIQDQPRTGDVCLFWDDEDDYATLMVYESDSVNIYDNCEKVTDENIKKVMEQIKLNNK